jgi:hypothetical protein
MEHRKPKRRGSNPESGVQTDCKRALEFDGWYVQNIHGNKFQSGLPDLLIWHPRFPGRCKWLEIKTKAREYETNGGLSQRQIKKFREMEKWGAEIYVANDPAKVRDLVRGTPNWSRYLRGDDRGHRKRPIGF